MKYLNVLAMMLCALVSRAAGQPYFPYRTIAATGQNAPQTETGTIYQQIGTPTINSRGEVAYSAFLSGPRVSSNYQGVWISSGATAQLLARSNDIAPGTTRRFSGFDEVWMLGDGQAAFKATFSDLTPGIWSGRPGAVNLNMLVGNAAPGTAPGTTFSELVNYALEPSGQIAFSAVLAGGGIDPAQASGIWAGPLGGPVPIIRAGEHAPDMAPDVVFKGMQLAAFSGTGAMLFSAAMSGEGLTNLDDEALYAGRAGNFRLVVRQRGPAIGTAAGTNVFTLFDPAMTDKGVFAYRAAFGGPEVDASNSIGLYAGLPGNVHLIARRGWQAPGLPTGVTYQTPGAPAFDRATGSFAFASTLNTPEADPAHHSALFYGSAESFDPVVYTGTPVPGVANAVFSSFGPIALNGNGQMAFIAYIIGTGIDTGRNNQGIWATDLNGQLHLVARTGVPFAITPTDSAVATSLSFATSDYYDIGQFAFNDSGQLAFHAEFFGSREGIFLASTVPEPAECAFAFAALMILTRRTRRLG